MPVYRVDLPGSDLPRVVEADNPTQAVQHVVKDSVSVRRLDVAEAFGLAGERVVLERAGEAPPPAFEPQGEGVDLGTANEDDAKRPLMGEDTQPGLGHSDEGDQDGGVGARPMDQPEEGYARDVLGEDPIEEPDDPLTHDPNGPEHQDGDGEFDEDDDVGGAIADLPPCRR